MTPIWLTCEQCGRPSIVGHVNLRLLQRWKRGWKIADAFKGTPEQLEVMNVKFGGVCRRCLNPEVVPGAEQEPS